jgi:NAD(P)-dependent dehydrogenase (short-subunit alcohol dehydrogenase family)
VEFKDKVVAITGASGGIGRELCRYFGGEGATIAAFDQNPAVTEFADELRKAGIKVESAVVDIGDPKAVKDSFGRLRSALGDPEILINNAGVSKNPALGRTTPDGWADDVNANLNGAYNCSYAVLPGMLTLKKGVIINIGSVNGFSALGDAAYSAGKAGMVSLTRSLAQEFGRLSPAFRCRLIVD